MKMITLDEAIEKLNDEHKHEFVLEPGQLEEWLTELKEAKRLLKAAVKDIGDMSRYCLGINCDHCPHIHTLSRGYQSCIWQHEEEALALIGEVGDPGD